MPVPTFQTLYDQTTVDTTIDTPIAPIRGRDEVLIDSSGVGVATIQTKSHPDGNYKTAVTLTNDDQAAVINAPFWRVIGVGVAGRFIVGFGIGPVGP